MKGRVLQAHFAKVKFYKETIISFAKRACNENPIINRKYSSAHLQLEIRKLQMSLPAFLSLFGEKKLKHYLTS
jgi:hypothetical protein